MNEKELTPLSAVELRLHRIVAGLIFANMYSSFQTQVTKEHQKVGFVT